MSVLHTKESVFAAKHPKVMALVIAVRKAKGISKMRAYDYIGKRIGASGRWVRGFLGRRPGVRMDHHWGLNLDALHDMHVGPKLAAVSVKVSNIFHRRAAMQGRA